MSTSPRVGRQVDDRTQVIRILYICSSWPRGRTFGGQIRALYVGRALQRMGRVSVLVVGSAAEDLDAMAETAGEFDVLPPMIPERGPAGIAQRFRKYLDSRYMNLTGYVASAVHQARLDALRPEFDLTWVLNARTPNILNRWEWPGSHLDVDDIPSTYLRTVARNAPRLAERLKASIQRRQLHRHELQYLHRFTTLSVCSEPDRKYLGYDKRIHVIPNGFERPPGVPIRRLNPAVPRIGFIGLFSYLPNVDGVRWFLAHCWPAITEAVPGVRLRLIGKDTDGPLKPLDGNVDALGWVANPGDEIATWSAMIVPIRLGGGTRIKIAEAFSRMCPAVSTPMGAYGYEVSSGRELLVADRPADFSQACIDLIRSPSRGAEIAQAAWKAFLANWTWDAINPKVCTAAEDCLRRANPR